MKIGMLLRAVLCGTALAFCALHTQAQPTTPPPVDLDHGNAAIEAVIPYVAPVTFQYVSATGGDATLVLRITTQITNAWFDASAPYHPSAVGVYSRLGRRPANESANNRNINIALLYASYRVLNTLLPLQHTTWRAMLEVQGLDPDDNSTDLTTPIGIGNAAGMAVAEGRLRDGMNQVGDETRSGPLRAANPMPYMDYTGYQPINTAYTLFNPSRWQPDIQRKGMGLYKIQQFVTPQYAFTEPYSYKSPRRYRALPPIASFHWNFAAYKQQADEVLVASANLTDEQKLMAELFDNKIESLGFSAGFAALSQELSLMEFIHFDFLTNMAAHDAGIFVWQEKRRYDAVRPFSAIQYIYGKQPVTAWGGPGQGTQSIPANTWKSYLEEADHPEYPSASTCFCTAHAQSARQYLGSDALNWSVPYTAGSSRIEPGVTPASDMTLEFPTWTSLEENCGQSRVWAGVHFQAAVDEGRRICGVFGDNAYNYLQTLIAGTAPVREPANRLRGRRR
ncbi:vanadium-dependent haloperoxidase [Microbulbifer elongatus]|uniref:vanadium-dependent haloperoxidase n=1 Tax=Microbulbifer elongatus TaxID=86173 RepID=UPI001E52D5CB|nr:vanadium-dependent haloperoxidase [Microbulbifer elongatus]